MAPKDRRRIVAADYRARVHSGTAKYVQPERLSSLLILSGASDEDWPVAGPSTIPSKDGSSRRKSAWQARRKQVRHGKTCRDIYQRGSSREVHCLLGARSADDRDCRRRIDRNSGGDRWNSWHLRRPAHLCGRGTEEGVHRFQRRSLLLPPASGRQVGPPLPRGALITWLTGAARDTRAFGEYSPPARGVTRRLRSARHLPNAAAMCTRTIGHASFDHTVRLARWS